MVLCIPYLLFPFSASSKHTIQQCRLPPFNKRALDCSLMIMRAREQNSPAMFEQWACTSYDIYLIQSRERQQSDISRQKCNAILSHIYSALCTMRMSTIEDSFQILQVLYIMNTIRVGCISTKSFCILYIFQRWTAKSSLVRLRQMCFKKSATQKWEAKKDHYL